MAIAHEMAIMEHRGSNRSLVGGCNIGEV